MNEIETLKTIADRIQEQATVATRAGQTVELQNLADEIRGIAESLEAGE